MKKAEKRACETCGKAIKMNVRGRKRRFCKGTRCARENWERNHYANAEL